MAWPAAKYIRSKALWRWETRDNVSNGRLVQRVLADDLAVEFNDRNSGAVLGLPRRPIVNIAHLYLARAPDKRQQFLDQLLTEMTPFAAVNNQRGHVSVTASTVPR